MIILSHLIFCSEISILQGRFPPRSGLNFIAFLSFLRRWVIIFGIRTQGLGVSLLHMRHLGIFAIIVFLRRFRRNPLEDI